MNYAELIADSKPHVVLFYGPACAPCARLKPRMVEMAAKLGFDLHKLNVASEMDVVRALGIRGVPTVVAINNGEAEVLFTGELPDPKIALMLHAAGVLSD